MSQTELEITSAALAIQRAFRRYQKFRAIQKAKIERNLKLKAAILIQRFYRRFQTEKQRKGFLATKIQRTFRGFVVRKIYLELIQAKKELKKAQIAVTRSQGTKPVDFGGEMIDVDWEKDNFAPPLMEHLGLHEEHKLFRPFHQASTTTPISASESSGSSKLPQNVPLVSFASAHSHETLSQTPDEIRLISHCHSAEEETKLLEASRKLASAARKREKLVSIEAAWGIDNNGQTAKAFAARIKRMKKLSKMKKLPKTY